MFYPQKIGSMPCDSLLISSQHGNMFYADPPQRPDYFGCLRPHGIRIADDADDLIIDGYTDRGDSSFPERLIVEGRVGGNVDSQLRHVSATSHVDLRAVDARR